MKTPLDGLRSALKPAQEAALAELEDGRLSELTRAEYEEIGGVSRSQAAYDLADLVTLGILERFGTGRATRYRLPGARVERERPSKPSAASAARKPRKRTPSGGRPRKWTDERIRAELEDFCAQDGHWPRAAEFREAGRNDLYLAASRYGGIDYWAATLGLRESKSRRPRIALPAVPWERLVSWAPAAVTMLAVVGLAGALLEFDRAPWQLISSGSTAQENEPSTARSGGGTRPDSAPASKSGPQEKAAAGSRAAPAAVERRSQPMFADLSLVARFGNSWLAVRRGSATSRTVYEGTLTEGRSLHFRGKRLWLRLGAPHNLAARLGARRVDLPESTSTVLVTRKGLRVVRTSQPFTPPPETPDVVVDSPATLASATGGASSSPRRELVRLCRDPVPGTVAASAAGSFPRPQAAPAVTSSALLTTAEASSSVEAASEATDGGSE